MSDFETPTASTMGTTLVTSVLTYGMMMAIVALHQTGVVVTDLIGTAILIVIQGIGAAAVGACISLMRDRAISASVIGGPLTGATLAWFLFISRVSNHIMVIVYACLGALIAIFVALFLHILHGVLYWLRPKAVAASSPV